MGYKQLPIKGGFHGIISNTPPPLDDIKAFDDILNFFCREGRLQSRPALTPFGPPPDGAILRNATSFTDIAGSVHTLALTTKNAYFITAGPVYNLLTYPLSLADLSGTSLPYGMAYINNRVYFSNGSTTVLYADGEADLKDSTANAAAKFMSVLNSHLILVNTIEPPPGSVNSTAYPHRIRWSKSGDPNDWTSFTSGFEDSSDVADEFSGIAVLGSYAYVFRPNGITIMSPTGNGGAPFNIQQYSYSLKGVGNKYPYSLATYGNLCAFVAADDIYTMTLAAAPQRITPPERSAKKKIFADIGKAAGDQIVGFFVSDFGPSYDFLSYWLSIPGPNVTWVYHFDDGSWQRFNSALGRLTCISNAATG
jgi:hypothetical protein